MESYEESVLAIDKFAVDPRYDLGNWAAHGPALSVYAMWTVRALAERRVLDAAEATGQLALIAESPRV